MITVKNIIKKTAIIIFTTIFGFTTLVAKEWLVTEFVSSNYAESLYDASYLMMTNHGYLEILNDYTSGEFPESLESIAFRCRQENTVSSRN